MKRGMPPGAPLTAKPKAGGKARTGDTVVIRHRGTEVARVVYRPHAPLKSGATAWVETDCDVEVLTAPPPAPAAPADLAAALRVLVAAHEPEIRRLLAERAGEK